MLPPNTMRLPVRTVWLALAFAVLAGCSLIKETLELPDRAVRAILDLGQGRVVDPVELQSEIIRFADQYMDTIYAITGKMLEVEQTPQERIQLLQRREFIGNDVVSVATGSNIFENLLDMVILVSLTRMNLEESGIPTRFAAMGKPLLTASREAEKEIRRIALKTLTVQQLEQLEKGIVAWHQQHPGWKSSIDVGSTAFAADIKRLRSNQADTSTSVFDLLMLDPLSQLDPATRELTNTRLFAERGLFTARHLPNLIRGQAELMALQTIETPQIGKLLDSTEQLAQATQRFSLVAETLPAAFSAERGQIVAALNQQRPGLISLATQTGQALTAGQHMSDATKEALKSFEEVLRQLRQNPDQHKGKPFDIAEYTQAAAAITASAQQLEKLLDSFNQTVSPHNLDALTARLEQANQQAQASGKALLDYALIRLLLLVGGSCLMILASCLAYWRLKKRYG